MHQVFSHLVHLWVNNIKVSETEITLFLLRFADIINDFYWVLNINTSGLSRFFRRETLALNLNFTQLGSVSIVLKSKTSKEKCIFVKMFEMKQVIFTYYSILTNWKKKCLFAKLNDANLVFMVLLSNILILQFSVHFYLWDKMDN